MLPIDKLLAVKHIVTHEHCADGLASAMILKNVLPYAKVTFLQYDTNEHKNLKTEEGVLFCDFSPHKSTVDAFREAGAIVLDHHKTQKEVVEQFGELGVFADEKTEPGVCGAVLAFREVWTPLSALRKFHVDDPSDLSGTPKFLQEFATLAGIRDTWQKDDPRWRQACEQAEALTFWPEEELLALALRHSVAWPEKLALGPMLFDRRLRGAQGCLDKGYTFQTSKGRKVIMFEGLRQSSDAAEIAGSAYDFVVGFGYTTEEDPSLILADGYAKAVGCQIPSVIYSTRSHTTFDCSAFCLAHGGGGHTKAAGCRVVLGSTDPQPYELLKQMLLTYERVEDQWLQIIAANKGKEGFQPKDEYTALVTGFRPAPLTGFQPMESK